MAVALMNPEQHWVCPNCTFTDVTFQAGPVSRFHSCKGMALMSMPMVLEGTHAKVELQEREDWVGDDMVQTDAEGKPWMAAVVTRDDGQDRAVYAATATMSAV
jgi:hypothetical protein